ncbi:HlyD family type I secretion periplasmic adaptor subunit [Herbaspirillum sp. LeCh32-8]|uniref:HlyD family type I secretion periplasmic adaptor subunit n=1 Tax=Herbaspirillum sp. LeCh32-8 TaxID=2821356 RepID=UPI001AE3BBBD|nr:HlyD family type I secretion periplasmic adaptor subunit [Herbaspirillum sp. LeCh32-8]MBP0598491.1 HlyD family type I secretion periplasmic adaptor subunit [Herbaspirillum sp. LeCh32-8]
MTLRHSIGAWKDLCKRYHEVWSHFWRQREQLSPPALQAHEAEFLPAALALQAQPVSPMGRWVARILMALILVLLLWSTLGRIDIIVNAQGKIIPSDRTKTISAVEVASVQAIHVKEGQAVKAGDALIELDARSSNAEESKAEGEWQNAFLQAARSRALLQALQGGAAPVLPANREIAPARWRDADNQLLDEWRDFTAKRERLDGDIQRYGQALPLAAQQADSYADLARSHDVAEHAWLDKEQQKIDLEGQLRGARNQRNALLAETRKQAQDSLNEALRAMAAARQDAQRASAHGDLLRLVSPIDGTVQQLKTYTVGAAVPAAQPLMEIVPARGVVEMEAAIENKDVGFVEEGQTAAVKIDAFEYTRYGTLPAKVTHVSRDAIQDEKRGLIYTVKVELERPDIMVNGRAMPLSAGMSGTVEIKTGTRRVIEYVLSPLLQHGRESLHER